ncbi:MAG: class I SAM-dependent methyltransferase [Acidobacteria bacterium]|nr:class I SAM-dependent methyltransferase [Acidobacteriota bacterium]
MMNNSLYNEGGIHLRYERARGLSEATLNLWLERLSAHVPREDIRTIIDLGCGTGRFSVALARHFSARVYGIEPSPKMLSAAREAVNASPVQASVVLMEGTAERIPLDDKTAEMLFLSMVYHHIVDKELACAEFKRVLKPPGHLCIRTATRERIDSFLWLRFFPEAREIESRRMLSGRELKTFIEARGFRLAAHEVVRQMFAGDLNEYYERISERALSVLQMIPDETFARGLLALGEHCATHDTGQPVCEEIDLFVFRADGV